MPHAYAIILALRNFSFIYATSAPQSHHAIDSTPKRGWRSIATSIPFTRRSGGRKLPLAAGLILDNVSRHRARRHRQRRRQIHLPRPAPSREISILRADYNLIRTRRYSRPRIDARPATRFNQMRAGFLENLDVAAALRILTCLLRAELDPKVNTFRNSFSLFQSIAKN